MKELSEKHPCYGCRRIAALLRQEGWTAGKRGEPGGPQAAKRDRRREASDDGDLVAPRDEIRHARDARFPNQVVREQDFPAMSTDDAGEIAEMRMQQAKRGVSGSSCAA